MILYFNKNEVCYCYWYCFDFWIIIYNIFRNIKRWSICNAYSQGYDKDSFYGIDKELLDEIGNKLFEGIDKDRLVNNALNLLNEYDIDIGALEEQLLQDSGSYAGGFVLILVLFILLVIIGAGFGFGTG